MAVTEHILKRTCLTKGSRNYFFGYYDKNEFNLNGRYLLGMATSNKKRKPTPRDQLSIGVIDLEDGNCWKTVGYTTAWCWQQGCMLQWSNSNPESEIIYNIRNSKKGRYEARIHNIKTGRTRTLGHPIYTLSPNGKYGVSNDFARVGHTRPGYGYNGIADPNKRTKAPADSSIKYIDMKSGRARPLITVAQLAQTNACESLKTGVSWTNHILVSPDSRRIIFLHRWGTPKTGWETRMYTISPAGKDLRYIMGPGLHASHFAWRDPDHIIVFNHQPPNGNYLLINEKTGRVRVLHKNTLKIDGHMTYSPAGNGWIVSDTYPNAERMQQLFLIHEKKGEKIIIDRLRQPKSFKGEFRCDLHPRWSRDGKKVAIDSLNDGTRRIYLYDVSEIVK